MAKNNSKAAPANDSTEKSSKKWPIVILAVVLSLSALAGGLVASVGVDSALKLVMGDGGDAHVEDVITDPNHIVEEEQIAVDAELIVAPLKEIIVNITAITETGRKSSRFLKVNLALVFDENAEGAEHVLEREVYIRDAFQNYLRQLTERDLSGSIGVIRVKSELLRRARAIAESDAPQEVLIADIIVQ